MAPTKGKLTAEAVGKASADMTNGILNPAIRKPNRQLIREKTESERAAERTAAWVLQTSRLVLPPSMLVPDHCMDSGGSDHVQLQQQQQQQQLQYPFVPDQPSNFWPSRSPAAPLPLPTPQLQFPMRDSGTRGRLDDTFYDRPCEELARRLLGQVVVRRLDNGQRLAGRVVETESYLGGPDAASHSYQGRQTPGNVSMFMKPGTAYVYCIYGMYRCFNISSGGKGSAVLIRALEPLDGLDVMRRNRGAKRKDGGTTLQDKDLCSGPSKICMALDITKELLDQRDLVTSDTVWIERGEDVSDEQVVTASRVGIGPSAGEWRGKPLRCYVRGNAFVSSRDKKAEAALLVQPTLQQHHHAGRS